jgi:hypothetical protein
MVFGLGITGFGLLLVQQSVLAAVWIGGIGVFLFLAGAIATDWVGDALGLGDTTRRRLALACAGLSVLFLLSFVLLNSASFESGETSGLFQFGG